MQLPPRWVGRAVLVLRVALGLCWLYAGAVKLLHPSDALQAVRAYQLFPEWAVVMLGYALPFAEVAVAVLLVVGLGTRAAAAVSAVLLLAFMVLIATAWARGLQIGCGCFGSGGFSADPAYVLDLLRDAVLLAVSLVLVAGPPSAASLDDRLRRSPRRPHRALVPVAVVVAIGLVTGVGLAAQVAARGTTDPKATVPQGTTTTYGVPVGSSSAPVTVSIYEDFACPYCARLEAHIGRMLDDLVAGEQVRVVYQPVSYLDRLSTDDYSTRSLNAAVCALDLAGPDAFAAVHDELYAQQPPEHTPGLSDAELVDLAVGAGAPRSPASACVDDLRFAAWVSGASRAAGRAGVSVVPQVRVDGEVVEFTDREVPEVTLQRVIDEALAGS